MTAITFALFDTVSVENACIIHYIIITLDEYFSELIIVRTSTFL